MVDTSVELCGLRLDNPVVPASGTFGYGNEFQEFYDINVLGSFSFKRHHAGAALPQPPPVSPSAKAGMINAVGLQNPGIDAVIREELPRLKTFFRNPSSPISRILGRGDTPTAASGSTSRSRSD